VLMVANMMYRVVNNLTIIANKCVVEAMKYVISLEKRITFIVVYTVFTGMEGHGTAGFLVTRIQTVSIFRSTAG
jgi:hypothetical protein